MLYSWTYCFKNTRILSLKQTRNNSTFLRNKYSCFSSLLLNFKWSYLLIDYWKKLKIFKNNVKRKNSKKFFSQKIYLLLIYSTYKQFIKSLIDILYFIIFLLKHSYFIYSFKIILVNLLQYSYKNRYFRYYWFRYNRMS